ncbi:MAG: flagellar basal body P-ring formation protein FlgA [Devosia sp.]|uniref:flagellar basal body P-ring formation chaperone FlgA n=1 Tax=Devosia sp. TaxID=1871048 RepID=UPI0024C97FFF|nr:flagellar basal body P-ring formation chaperone FlgA [Devosia sp.]UYO00672.1 MAG: flagellar basal body P-ring formation protein FlgA [Devosia sp.]
MNALRTITASLAIALGATTAFANPVLRAEITVVGTIVTVGDMFDDAGLDAERPLFRSPLPGTTGNVALSDIRQAMTRAGISGFDANGLDQVRVSRASALVDEVLLTGLIADDLRRRGILTGGVNANTQFTAVIGAIQAAATDEPARLESLRYLPGNGTFSARFVIAGVAQPLDVTGSVEMTVDAPYLAAALPAGAILKPEHIAMRPIPAWQADAQGIPAMDQLVGKALNRPSRDGMLLRATDVATPLTIAKNDLVTIYFRQGPMTLTVKGQAVTGAASGSPLQVLNLASRRVISATAIGPGLVEISTDPVALAGL